ncbi:MAG: hypothetical protein EA427_16125 [Spirochaetaceae bacterium]|nr:MAG: hypothetical protein EA427_16125 [Spirochaetaceae bacterium]
MRGHWEAEGDVIVDIEPLKAFLRDALQRSGHEGLLRCKGVVRTQSGWQLLQWTEDGLALESFAPQETSRLEWIATGQSESDRLRRLLTG